MPMKIGDRIRCRREELKLSQEELAKRLGYKSRSSINKIERDASGLPQSKIVDIAKALQTTPAYIMGWEEVQKKNDTLSDIIVKMRIDENYMSVCEMLYSVEDEKLVELKQFLKAFLK